ncbi:hypothetical protein BGZ80_000981 [Entomortierella chlamydospora]|uniref:NodB homology domain-containing protein n=1 Tax=Entomortierella chlamydospora TaxID=101097 RepID=A0A9P6SYM0_9FUNG|nr:hypothetical protein BGZ79_001778 [Entomortierella chlamydospora]KAG0011055.1 hypothetical protein BGZ80_000981 [Entomortierella chlamydospora]
MKINAILSLSALFLASVATAVMPDDPDKIDTCTKPGVVALTFDDGPGIYNDQLLALLAKKNVKATFFMLIPHSHQYQSSHKNRSGSMVAESPAQAASLKKILAAGHQLASHTYTHGNLDNMTEEQQKKEISMTSDIMFQHSGIRPAYMRAPEGRCAAACTKVMTELGLVISHWNVDTNDWRFKALSPEEATEKSLVEINQVIVKDSNPATDSFILLEHEIHKFSVDLLAERVIDTITAKGYKFVTMEECVGKPAYLSGSTVPSTNPTSVSTGVPTGVPTNSTALPATTTAPTTTSGSVVPTNATTGTTTSTTTGTTTVIKKDSSAGFHQAGAWAMGMVVAVAYALI